MHLKTPKRYRPGRRERRFVGSWQSIRNLWLLVICGALAYWLYQNQLFLRQSMPGLRTDMQEAISGLSTAIPRAPTPTPDVVEEAVSADTAYQIGDFDRAIQTYNEVIKGQPNNPEAFYRLAYALIISSDFGANTAYLEQALQASTGAINADPEAPDGWAIKAWVLVWLERYGEAIAYAQRALEIDPTFVQATAFMAEAYWRLEEQEQADQLITEAVEFLRGQGSAPSETVAIVFRTQGYIAERQLDRDKAIQAYETALQAAPSQTFIGLELALSYFGNGQTDEAIALLNRILDQRGPNRAILFQLGQLYVNTGRNEEALQTLQRCVEANPTYAPCLSWLGGLFFVGGNYPQAISNLDAAISNGSEDWSDWLQLGLAYSYSGRCELAEPFLQQGYRMVSDNPTREERFASALRECGFQPNQAIPMTPTPTSLLTPTPTLVQ
jgi:tetratricopeptide (TPR) repeat protein